VRRVGVVGSGYVGTVVAGCFADIGHAVVALELDQQKVESLSSGVLPFHEPELEDLLRSGLQSGRLRFTSDVDDAVSSSDVIFLCVGTPSAPSGRPDLSALESALRSIARVADGPKVLVTKSTVPVGTGNWVASVVDDEMARRDAPPVPMAVVSNPEFLREGLAVHDFLNPDRVVVGSDDPDAQELVVSLYAPILERAAVRDDSDEPVMLRTALCAAEMIKYASNAYLATKISFANEIANICERVGADVTDVTQAIGLDTRIGSKFLDAGVGWGGSCFGKDLSALVTTAHELGYTASLLNATVTVNRQQRIQVVEKLQRHLGTLLGRRIAVLGLAFKPGTDDTRDAPAVDIARLLLDMGAIVRAHDPVVTSVSGLPELVVASDPYAAATRADAVVVVTEWPEYQVMDLDRLRSAMRGDLLVDARNVFDPATLRAADLRPVSFGRLDAPTPRQHSASMSI
jgi:UDPglucose 6-dehydrogenase